MQRVGSDRLPGLAKVLGWLEGEAVQRALTRLLGHEAVRSQVVEALVRHGAGVVALLIEQLRAEDLETRQAAAVALGRIGDRRATPALVDALRDPELAVPAAGALARIGDRDAFEGLLALLGEPDPAIRQSVIAALNSIGHPDMAARIAPLLGDPDPLVRESALRIAGYFGYPECLERVLHCCRDPNEAVRRAAVESLAFFDDPRVVPTLVDALEHDSRRGTRRAPRRRWCGRSRRPPSMRWRGRLATPIPGCATSRFDRSGRSAMPACVPAVLDDAAAGSGAARPSGGDRCARTAGPGRGVGGSRTAGAVVRFRHRRAPPSGRWATSIIPRRCRRSKGFFASTRAVAARGSGGRGRAPLRRPGGATSCSGWRRPTTTATWSSAAIQASRESRAVRIGRERTPRARWSR